MLVVLAQSSMAATSAMPMIKIDGGAFKSGADQKSVKVKTFQIDKYEVPNSDFKKVITDHQFPEGKETHPATEVSYFDAEKYCKTVGKRLPTGLEWEKAARGKDGRIYPWGNDFDSEKANTSESDNGGTTPVGAYKNGKSPYGVFGMSGNVWEWVDAWYSEDMQYRAVYGGSFFDPKSKAKTFSTLQSIPDDSHTYIGFRCAK